MKFWILLTLTLPCWTADLTITYLSDRDQRYVTSGNRIRLRGYNFREQKNTEAACPGQLTLFVNGRQILQQPSGGLVRFDISFLPLDQGWQEILLEYRDPTGQCAPSRLWDVAHSGPLGPPYYRIWPSNLAVRLGEHSRIAGILPPGTPALMFQDYYAIQLAGIESGFNSLFFPPFYEHSFPHTYTRDTDVSPRLILMYGPIAAPIITLANPDLRFLRDGVMRLETVTGQTVVSSSEGMELFASFDSGPTRTQIRDAELVWYDGTTVLGRSPASGRQQLRLPALSGGRHALRVEIRGSSSGLRVDSNILNLDINPTSRLTLSVAPATGAGTITETDRVTLLALVESGGRPVSAGEVEFLLRASNGTDSSVGKSPLRDGAARIELSNLATGPYRAIARFSGAGSIGTTESAVDFRVDSGLSVRNAASGSEGLAPNSIASLYGRNLTTQTLSSSDSPTTLGGVRIEFEDSSGRRSPSRLLYISPGQVNFLVPDGLALGRGQIMINLEGRTTLRLNTLISASAPGIFTVDGQKIPTAIVSVLRRDGSLTQQFTFRCLLGEACRPEPIVLPDDTTEAVLTLYATGVRAQAATALALISDQYVDVLYAGAQSEFPGLDQINLRLPLLLRQRGTVSLVFRTREAAAQAVELNFR